MAIVNEVPASQATAFESMRGQVLADPVVQFGRDIAGDLPTAEQREWLVTNGVGGFASGTIAGSLTRRYHGLLFAALKPPLGRTLLVSHLQEIAEYNGQRYELATCRWSGGAVSPAGHRLIESFWLDGATPVWVFAFADALVEKRVWMQQGVNTTYISYKLVRGTGPVNLQIKALVNYRDSHASTHAGGWRMNIDPVEHGIRILAFEGAAPFRLISLSSAAEPAHEWYYNFDLAVERCRGLDDREDHLHAATFRAVLNVGEGVTIVATTERSPNLDVHSAARAHGDHGQALLQRWFNANRSTAQTAPGWIRQLVLAADQFVVRRPLADDSEGCSLIAGYHWFGDWGRDTMIALPGLTLTTGRPEIAAKILRTFARFVDRGMLPNVFSDAVQSPEYNTADAALWYFEAIRQYLSATGDLDLLNELYPVLTDIVDWHRRGTRYNIRVDHEDGLLLAGQPGVQLTWMDAKVGDWVVTPRIGKPVEINALWLNAVTTLVEFGRLLKRPTAEQDCLAKRARAGFARFWNEARQCCFDVLDGPHGHDASIRPNQIFAVSLPVSPLTPDQQRAVVDTCARRLLTSHGLRSLAPDDPAYRAHYGGSRVERDGAYHQGTVWGWLLGPFALAHLRVHNDPAQAAQFLEPLAHHLNVHGLGSISEIFDGDPPFTPRGCIAQAWSVAEVLRAWTIIGAYGADQIRNKL
jgi:predicted glycogen debranching enzyme